MRFLHWLNRNKTRVTGALIVALGAVQAQAALIQPILSPRAYAWLMVGMGALVSTLGFLNSRQPPDPASIARDHYGADEGGT